MLHKSWSCLAHATHAAHKGSVSKPLVGQGGVGTSQQRSCKLVLGSAVSVPPCLCRRMPSGPRLKPVILSTLRRSGRPACAAACPQAPGLSLWTCPLSIAVGALLVLLPALNPQVQSRPPSVTMGLLPCVCRCLPSIPRFNPVDLSTALWALAKLRWSPPEAWVHAALSTLRAALPDFSSSEGGGQVGGRH